MSSRSEARDARAPLHALLARLEPARRVGHGFMARCPAHADARPSLSITTSHDGRVLLYCFNGCKTQTILTGLGLTWADLFAEGPKDYVKRSVPPLVCELDMARGDVVANERRQARRRAKWEDVLRLADEARHLDRLLLRARQAVNDRGDDPEAWELEERATELQRMMMNAEAGVHEAVAGRSLW